MKIALDLPEDISQRLESKWGDLSQHTLETLALDGYRSGILTAAQVRRVLGFQTRMEVDAFLKKHGVYLEYTLEDLEREREIHRQLRSR